MALDLLLRKLVGTANDGKEGDKMAEATSDFSKILQLSEVKEQYDDLQARYADDIKVRDHEIEQLRAKLQQVGGEGNDRFSALQAENTRLADQVKVCREEYETKLARANASLKAMKAMKAKSASTEELAGDSKKRGFFS